MALETPSWLNLEFFESMLRKLKNDDSIRVTDIFTKPATAKGDNYASDMFRVTMEISRKRGDRNVSEKRSFVVKVAPTGDNVRTDMIRKVDIFRTEILMMRNALKKMNELLGPGHTLGGRVFHVQTEFPQFLVIEDLAILGFRMADRQAGLDLAHCLLAIRGLARFHASSVALCEKEPNQKNTYTRGIFCSQHPSDIASFFVLGTKTLGDQLKKWPELEKYSEKVEKLSDVIYEKGCETASTREGEFNVINHGDSWVNNMMFSYNEEGKPIDHIFVDFQMCVYGSPVIDLLYFLNTSLSDEVYENSKDKLLEEYYETLTRTMRELGCKTVPPSFEKLKETMKEREFLGVCSSFTVLPLVLLDKSEAKSLDEIMDKDGSYNNPSYSNELYRKVLRKRLPYFDQRGLLDL